MADYSHMQSSFYTENAALNQSSISNLNNTSMFQSPPSPGKPRKRVADTTQLKVQIEHPERSSTKNSMGRSHSKNEKGGRHHHEKEPEKRSIKTEVDRMKANMREEQIKRMKKTSRRIDTVAAILALLSGVIVYNENEEFHKEKFDDNGNRTKYEDESNGVCTGLRVLNMVITFAICILVYLHYRYKLNILKLRKLKLAEDTLQSAGLLPLMIVELALCIIFTPPGVDTAITGKLLGYKYTYTIDAIFCVITLLKSYLVLRLYGQYSPWTNEKSAKICAKHKAQASVTFAIKSELKKRPYLMLGIMMCVTIIYLGFAIRTFEMSYEGNKAMSSFDFNYLANAFWLTIITMTTVGFGDGYPSTHLGRAVGVVACIIGMLLVSLMVVSLTNASEFSTEESKAFFILKRIYANDEAKEKAANVIKSIFKLRKVVRGGDVSKTVEKFVWLTKLKKQIAVFKNDYRVANSQNLPVDEMLKNLQEKLENDINDIKKEVVAIPELDARCSALRDRQTKISNRLEEIVKIQTSIADYLIKLNQLKRN